MTYIGEIILVILFLPAVVWIGFWASILDLKTGQVKNRLIKKGYTFGIIMYVLLLVSSILFTYVFRHTGIEHLKFVYFFDLLINLSVAFVFGFVFWKLDVWAAADAKIFALFSFLIPLTIYRYNKVPFFPSFAFLLNIFIIYIFFLALSFLVNLKRDDFNAGSIKLKFELLKNKFNFWKTAVAVSIFGMIFLLGFSLRVIQMPVSDYFPIIFYLVSFLLIRPLSKLLKKKKALFFVLVGIETGYVIWLTVFSDTFSFSSFGKQILNFSFYMLVILMAFRLLNLSTRSERKMVKTEEISARMVLTQSSFIRVKNKKGLTEDLGSIYPDGLLEKQSESLRDFLKKENITEIEVFKTFPFVPFIFIGAITTIIIGDSISHWIVKIIRSLNF